MKEKNKYQLLKLWKNQNSWESNWIPFDLDFLESRESLEYLESLELRENF